jgi:hypothetical protein
MRFEAFKAEYERARLQLDRMEKSSTREWIAPELIVVDVRIATYQNDVQLTIHTRRWKKDEHASCLVAGREFTGGFFDYVHRPLEELTPRQLEQVAFAKFQVERWIAGERESLPDQLWVGTSL